MSTTSFPIVPPSSHSPGRDRRPGWNSSRLRASVLVTSVEIDTPHGPARAHLQLVGAPAAALVLGHGAGGGVGAPDLVAAADAARSVGVSVALVEQPYRV